ncbi:putative mitochondrial hypothetical protein [Leptomonas pyrrhocoris]|uniref:Uncharacterized protein n=1 Tax=Leptomonas pyrrhocoris TaxID=157538 RepID=A0A0N0VEK1_LEPPY|nr:putative mitochondrial hypothetical protein [Leptomonas pyrrhocoris]KPA78208.1 putative mitochondrial hypothetical protein [Leptomonas pyrrhocoris]|eukprot:XP_015656647.1 putative mitochondrial hypothetical protein [Leptomonas pyrrhocoris]
MSHLSISKDGKLGCGSCFTSCQGNCVPGTINLFNGVGERAIVHPDHVAFSSFGVARSTRLGAESVYNPGDHVAMVYNDANTSFSTVIVRCDTWAVQWGVERSACLADARVVHLVNLCANTVCGIATSKSTTTPPGEQRVFIATRFDVPSTSRKANKEWRHFLAAPRIVVTGFENEGIVRVVAYDRNSFLLLTLKGSLALVRLNVDVLKSKQKTDVGLFEARLVGSKLRGVSAESRLVVYADDDADRAYAAIYSLGGSEVQLIQFSRNISESVDAPELAVVTEMTTGVPVDTLAFAGPFHLCFCSNRAQQNVQFCGLVPGAAALETMMFDPLTAPYEPLGVFYNDADERVVLLSSSLGCTTFAAASDVQKVSSIIETSLDFSAGPFGQDTLKTVSWSSVANPFRHHGPRTSRFAGKDSDQEDDGDVQVLEEATAHNAGRWTPLTLCYALASNNTPRGTDVAIFSVETAPFLHTRLIKQWHNATAGLKQVLGAVSTRSYTAVALPWNPRHIRRALRLLSQGELSALLHGIAVAISASERMSSSVAYADATTAAVGMALHVITLARQMGAALQPDDVKTVATMLRACRECGHELLRYASRMELLMESCLQQKAMSRILRRRPASTQGGDYDTATQDLERNFYGISAELQTERTLHTRYTFNTWAQHLASHESSHRSAGAGALRFLSLVKRGNESAGDRALSDWRRLGTAPHQDPVLDTFEQTLL